MRMQHSIRYLQGVLFGQAAVLAPRHAIRLFAHTTCTALRTKDFERRSSHSTQTAVAVKVCCHYKMDNGGSDWILPPAGAPAVADLMQELFSPAVRMLQDLSQGIASRRE